MDVAVSATMIVQAVRNANAGDDALDASYSLDIEWAKEFDDVGATAFVCLTAGEGSGVTDRLTVFSNVNHAADDSPSVVIGELWWQQSISDRAQLTFGKIDPTNYIDTNRYANDENSQFIASIFCNSPVVELPENTFGLRYAMPLTDELDIEIVLADADADFKEIGDALWWATQVAFTTDTDGRTGNYRLLGWYSALPHTKWNNPARTKASSYGFGISSDQEISDAVGLFLRAGWQDDSTYLEDADFSLAAAYSFGAQMEGTLWGRDNDVCGIGVGMIQPSSKYKRAQGLTGRFEGQMEIYYNMRMHQHLCLTPALQLIANPFGKDAPGGNATIVIAGIRTRINF
jgi:carbohydrate-selective porin OprB